MTQTEPLPDDTVPDDDVLAAELALGLLEGADLAEARRRQIAEPAFARQVARWRDHFAILTLDSADVPPPDALTARVMGVVRADGPNIVPLDSARKVARRLQISSWASGALVGGGLAAALAVLLIVRPGDRPLPPPPVAVQDAAPMLVAALEVPGTKATVLARLDGQKRLRLAGASPDALPVPAGRTAQLWVIAGTAAPRSLGLLHAGADGQLRSDGALTATATPALAPGAVLAISIEPLGGSPTGLPTGPVVASGAIRTL